MGRISCIQAAYAVEKTKTHISYGFKYMYHLAVEYFCICYTVQSEQVNLPHKVPPVGIKLDLESDALPPYFTIKCDKDLGPPNACGIEYMIQ